MFTGIAQEIITVVRTQLLENCQSVVLTRPQISDYVLGDSILLDGICSTIVAVTPTTVTVEYMPQTLRLTTAGSWLPGKLINCESPLTLQSKLSGALVLGHIDTTASIEAIDIRGESRVMTLQFTQTLPGHVVAQGGITVNGVNLTVADCRTEHVVIHFIPYTLQHSSFQASQTGDNVNIEFDYLAKLVLTQTESRLKIVA